MNIRNNISLVVIFICVCLIIASCSRHHQPLPYSSSNSKKSYGPPPHAPAHGYRRKHQHGVELVYNSGLGVYVVVGFPNHYYSEAHYFRLSGENWEISTHIKGPWIVSSVDVLPLGLKVKGKKKAKGKYKHKIKKHKN
jgi:hypothetical protein